MSSRGAAARCKRAFISSIVQPVYGSRVRESSGKEESTSHRSRQPSPWARWLIELEYTIKLPPSPSRSWHTIALNHTPSERPATGCPRVRGFVHHYQKDARYCDGGLSSLSDHAFGTSSRQA